MKHIAIILASIVLAQAVALGGDSAQGNKPGPLMKDFIGLNTHTIQLKPDLYSPICRLLRDYHGFGWDVADNSSTDSSPDTSTDTQFPLAKQLINWEDKSGKWKSFSAVPNWQEIYGSWQAEGFEIDASIQFGDLTIDKWTDPAADAYKYGKAFAEYFGPSGKAKLVTSVEIGNEPSARWKPEDYKVIFENMARGIRDGDPKLKIVTATTHVGKPSRYSFPVEIFKGAESLYDVINVHVYSQVEGWPTWKRSYPEDPSIEYLKIVRQTLAWRNTHAPGKELWITEFGYDCSTKPAPKEGTFSKWVDVSDEIQAQWLVRSLLEFAALGVDRAYIFWFNDNDEPQVHGSSGITRFLEPKKSYWALKHMYETLGNYRFNKVIKKSVGDFYAYEFVSDKDSNDCIWVLWSPTGTQREVTRQIKFPGKVIKAERMPMAKGPAEKLNVENLKVTESPAYVRFTRK